MAIENDQMLDRTFHALGDATRRHMIAMLAANGPLSASELGEPLDMAQPSVSKHLKVLEKSGLTRRRVTGRVHRFELAMAPMKSAQSWMSRQQAFWNGALDGLEQYLIKTDPTKRVKR